MVGEGGYRAVLDGSDWRVDRDCDKEKGDMKFPEQYRVSFGLHQSQKGDDFGAFRIPSPRDNRDLAVIASSGDKELGVAWEHVSVSLPNRCPTWPEMDFVKRLFWDDEESVIQLHPPRSRWINNHDYCLHMWRPLEFEIPLPPDIAVGVK